MKLIITIDTEEDDWGSYSRTEYSLRNIERIPRLQELFDEFNCKPTYLVTYPVATDDTTVPILKQIMDQGKCEIGTHCHPWNTPPFDEENTEKNSMLCNLSHDLQWRKLKSLHTAIIENFGVVPKSFRAGRWGYDEGVARNLYKLGYLIDSSISPFWDWRDYDGPDFSRMSPEPFRFNLTNIFRGVPQGQLVEIPATIAFLQQNFVFSSRVSNLLKSKFLRKLRLKGILYRLNLLNQVWLSPEMSDSERMIKITKVMIRKGFRLVNMFFHSTSLLAGLGPFVKNAEEEKQFLERIRKFLRFTRECDFESMPLCEAGSLV